MKKTILTMSIIACAFCTISNPAFSEDNIFGNLTTTVPSTSEVKTETIKVEQPLVIRGTTQMNKQESLTTQSLQTSISSLEAAQADLRTKLETARSNYNTVDQEYVRIKQERAALKKIVKNTEKRIKTIERTKEKIQKSIQSL